MIETVFLTLLVIALILLLSSIRQIDQFERGVKFQFGKFKSIVNPGWRLVFPVIQSMRKIDIRTKVIDVPEQDVISKDNISLRISAVLYFKVCDVQKAAIEVENFREAISQLALTTMKTIVGEYTLDSLLAERATISDKIKQIVAETTSCWGLTLEQVEIKDIVLPETMKRVIAREAEAEREKKAVITKASGEKQAAKDLSDAAALMATTPGALHLRTLATLTDISADKGNTIVFAIPVEILEAMGRAGIDISKPKKPE